MYVMIDNYDSFTYNLVHQIGRQGVLVRVVRNNKITIDEIEALDPEGIFISPGPGRPKQAGICIEAVKHFANRLPILGVCLGHQSIGEAFGARIIHADKLFHGKGSDVYHHSKGIFEEVKDPFYAMRYHSLLIDPDTLPDCLEVTARTKDGEIMGIRHKKYNVAGVQFHPESIMAQEGDRLIKNFLDRSKK